MKYPDLSQELADLTEQLVKSGKLTEDLWQEAYQKCFQWSDDERIPVKMAGFILMEKLAACEQNVPDVKFMLLLSPIRHVAAVDEPVILEPLSRALCRIGKRSRYLNKLAIETASEIIQYASVSAKAAVAAALRELKSDAVQSKLPQPPVRMIVYAAAE